MTIRWNLKLTLVIVPQKKNPKTGLSSLCHHGPSMVLDTLHILSLILTIKRTLNEDLATIPHPGWIPLPPPPTVHTVSVSGHHTRPLVIIVRCLSHCRLRQRGHCVSAWLTLYPQHLAEASVKLEFNEPLVNEWTKWGEEGEGRAKRREQEEEEGWKKAKTLEKGRGDGGRKEGGASINTAKPQFYSRSDSFRSPNSFSSTPLACRVCARSSASLGRELLTWVRSAWQCGNPSPFQDCPPGAGRKEQPPQLNVPTTSGVPIPPVRRCTSPHTRAEAGSGFPCAWPPERRWGPVSPTQCGKIPCPLCSAKSRLAIL